MGIVLKISLGALLPPTPLPSLLKPARIIITVTILGMTLPKLVIIAAFIYLFVSLFLSLFRSLKLYLKLVMSPSIFCLFDCSVCLFVCCDAPKTCDNSQSCKNVKD